MVTSKQYVTVDECGVYRVGARSVMLDGVAYGYQDGYSAETIQQMYGSLSLEEVYGAVAFYLANKAEVDQYLERQEALFDKLRAESERNPSEAVLRLRALATRPKERV